MSTEQQLISKWRNLPSDKQQKVLQFIESLQDQKLDKQTELGKNLRQIRAKIIASGKPLLDREEIEQEVINRRGGLQEIDQ